MRLDKYSNPIFNEQDLFEALYKGQALKPYMFVENTDETKKLQAQVGFNFSDPYPDDLDISVAGYDHACQNNWFMPEEYKTFDIEKWLYDQCNSQISTVRASQELEAYIARNMLDLLRWLKYFVDTCSKEGVVWGVGRGSSVASYVLYLIGVHSIDSIKYNLDWQEFLR